MRMRGGDAATACPCACRAGQVLAIVGRSGAGKTTLVNLIPRFYDVSGGAILIDGRRHPGRDARSRCAAQVAIVTQETVLFDDTIAANIAYGRPRRPGPRSRRRRGPRTRTNSSCSCRTATRRWSASGAEALGGQRQRLAIARAHPANSPLLILDEATSSLDAEAESPGPGGARQPDAQPHLVRHRAPAVHRAPRRRHRRAGAGRIVERGGTTNCWPRGGAYAKLYELQLQDEPAEDLSPARRSTCDQVHDRVCLPDARG